MISIHSDVLYDNHCHNKIPTCLPAGMAVKSGLNKITPAICRGLSAVRLYGNNPPEGVRRLIARLTAIFY